MAKKTAKKQLTIKSIAIDIAVGIMAIAAIICSVAALTKGFTTLKPFETETPIVDVVEEVAPKFTTLKAGDKITSWKVDFDADIDYDALIKDVDAVELYKQGDLTMNYYTIITFGEGENQAFIRVYEMKNVETGTSTRTLVIDDGVANDDNFWGGIHYSDFGWISPYFDGENSPMIFLLAVYQDSLLSEYDLEVAEVNNADVVATFMGIPAFVETETDVEAKA